MGCFLACFGTSKDGRRRKHRHKLHPAHHHQINPLQARLQSDSPALKQEISVEPINPVPDTGEKKEEGQLSVCTTRKRVTFDSTVRTYEHVSLGDSQDFSLENCGGVKKEEEEEKEEVLVEEKPSLSHSQSEDSSIISGSSGSYPTNHRYHSCRESDDELDGFEASDVDDDHDVDDDNDFDADDEGVVDSEDAPNFARLRAREGIIEEEGYGYEVESEFLRKRELSGDRNMRDRIAYMHPVLNPVENITQWKVVKTKGAALTNKQKENLKLDEEPPILFSSEPTFRESSLSFNGGKPRQVKKSTNTEMDVDASLSTWLGASEYSLGNRPAIAGPVNMGTPEKSMSCGSSNSPRSFDDRPILGALTLDEIKQFSATSSPRKSPNHSPDEMPIIGSVGTFWNNSGSSKDSVTVSSFKGMPNTTSKYREDKKVNWHSTPFETRLERALNGGAT